MPDEPENVNNPLNVDDPAAFVQRFEPHVAATVELAYDQGNKAVPELAPGNPTTNVSFPINAFAYFETKNRAWLMGWYRNELVEMERGQHALLMYFPPPGNVNAKVYPILRDYFHVPKEHLDRLVAEQAPVFVWVDPDSLLRYLRLDRLVEATDDDPANYLDWLGKKNELGQLCGIQFGAHIHTSDEQMIREHATEAGIDVDSPAFWDEVERCLAIIEANALQLLREAGLYVQDEGHGADGDRTASVWIFAQPIGEPHTQKQIALLKAILNWADGDWPSTTSGNFDHAFGAGATDKLYALTEAASRFIEVTIEFAGIEALQEWAKLNLVESTDPDDPEAFIQHYQPRLKADLVIDYCAAVTGKPQSVYKNVDAAPLFQHHSRNEMALLYKADSLQYQGNFRYRLNRPNQCALTRTWLESIGVTPEDIAGISTLENHGIAFVYITRKEFNNYLRMVYPNIRLREDLEDVDSPENALSFDPMAALLKAGYHPTKHSTSERELVKAWPVDLAGSVYLFVLRYYADLIHFIVRFGDNEGSSEVAQSGIRVGENWMNVLIPRIEQFMAGRKGDPKTIADELDTFLRQTLASLKNVAESEEPDVDKPEGYLDRVTGWIDTFVNAGCTLNPEATHTNQFWKKFELPDDSNYWLYLHVRDPLWIIAQRVASRTVMREIFEFPHGDIKGMTSMFERLNTLMTRARTRARNDFYVLDQEIQRMHTEHLKRRDSYLSGKLKEGIDDPPPDLLDKLSPEACQHCNNDLTQRHCVVRQYVERGTGRVYELSGHYDARQGYFTNDEDFGKIIPYLPRCDLPADCDICQRCGKSTTKDKPRRQESQEVDAPEPEQYLAQIHSVEDVVRDIQNYGLFVNSIRQWGRWLILNGGTFHNTEDNTEAGCRQNLERFLQKLGITQHHLKLGTVTMQSHVWFQLAIPKSQITPESWQPYRRNTSGWPAEPYSEWLPESVDDPDDADAFLQHHADIELPDVYIITATQSPKPDAQNPGRRYFLGNAHKGESGYMRFGSWYPMNPTQRNFPLEAFASRFTQTQATAFLRHLQTDHWTVTSYHDFKIESLTRFVPLIENVDDPDDPADNINRTADALDVPATMHRLGFEDLFAKGSTNGPAWGWQEGNKRIVVFPTPTAFEYEITLLTRPAAKVQVGRGRRWAQWSATGRLKSNAADLAITLEAMRRGHVVEGIADPDAPELNIERHTAALDLPALMQRLGFKEVTYRHSGNTHWEKVRGHALWSVRPSTGTPTVDVRMAAAFGTPQNWVTPYSTTCRVEELESVLNGVGFNAPVVTIESAADPDDPNVNIDRHIASMEPGPVLTELGFHEQWPTWNCADPEYMWWEKFDHNTGLKWTAIRKSEDAPHMMEVSISRSRKLEGHPLHDWQQVGGFICHVGDLKRRLLSAFGTNWKTYEALGDPDDPTANVERFAQQVAQAAQEKLDATIDSALADFDNAVEMRGIDDIKRADAKAAEVATFWAEQAGYENGSDEFDLLVSAVNTRCGEMFPTPESMFESKDEENWQEILMVLVGNGHLTPRAAERYKRAQNAESNARLLELFLELDELSQLPETPENNARFAELLGQMANVVTVANMRYGSALRDLANTVKVVESEEVDPQQFVNATFDVPTMLKRLRFEKNGNEWSKVYQQPPPRKELMLIVSVRGHGTLADSSIAIYDLVIYSGGNREWNPFKYIWGRTVLQLEPTIRDVEQHIRADTLAQVAG